MFSFDCGSVSCKETLSVFLLRNIGWHSVQFVCFLWWYLRAGSPMNRLVLFFFTFFIRICTHICCTAAPSGSLIWARHKILVDHSMFFHILFSFRGNMMVMATVLLYASLNFVPVLAVSLMWHSGVCLSLPRTPSSHQRYLDPWTTVPEFFLYQNDTYID